MSLLLLSCGLCDVGIAKDTLCVALALLPFFLLLAARCTAVVLRFLLLWLLSWLLGLLSGWKHVAQSMCVLLTPYTTVWLACGCFLFLLCLRRRANILVPLFGGLISHVLLCCVSPLICRGLPLHPGHVPCSTSVHCSCVKSQSASIARVLLYDTTTRTTAEPAAQD